MSGNNHFDVIILGSGPAGYTAAIYAARAHLDVLVLEGLNSGGQLMITTDVENYPGFPDGITGPEMMDQFRRQAERFGAELVPMDAVKADVLNGSPFKVSTDEQEYSGDALIIATGATAKYLGLESEDELKGFGVSACATCDGFFFTDKEVAVVGGGDTAMEEATYLTRHCTKVHIIHRRDELRASKIMQKRALKHEKIQVHWNKVVIHVLGSKQEGVTGLKLKDTETGEISELKVQGMFVAIGHKPNTDLFRGVLEMDEAGYIKADPGSTRTNVEGVFAAGDVRDNVYRQAVTAAGTGCMAAIDAERWLEAEKAKKEEQAAEASA
ncbi:MAG: Thioredoxin reductase [Calditrichaeota bacterium]|nr:Thioredoxin reductase [Calditrichota bacterium]